MSWDQPVPSLYDGSGLFAHHPADEDRAFAWLTDLRNRGVGWKAARQQLESYMTSKKWKKPHIQYQLKQARLMMKPWLTD